MQYVNYDKILPNVYVAGIDVGGMTLEEATAAIESSLTATEQQSVNVILPDQKLTFTPAQDTVLIDVDQAVAEAYNYGRNSSNPFTIARAIKAAQRTRNDIDISKAVTVDTDYIQQLIDTTAGEIATTMQESDVSTDVEARVITVTIGQPGRELDTVTLYNLVCNAFSVGDYSDIEFDYTMTYPATVALDTLYEQMTQDPEDAYYDPDLGEVVPEEVGYTPSVDLDEANEQLATAASGDVLTFTFDETYPEMTYDELSAVLFRDTLFSYGTKYAPNANRTENLRLACAAINDTVLQPGDVFSFNGTVGERTVEKGYREAIVYVDNSSEMQAGGGVCQVASTIYYCCLYADLEIVHREPHMYQVSYVPYGLDATVYWGSVDFQFRNSTDYPLKIKAYLSGGRVWIELIGTDTENNTVKMETRHSGLTYYATRYVYDAYGNLIRTDSTSDLDAMAGCGTSVYREEKEDTPTPSFVVPPTTSQAPETTPPASTSPEVTPPVTTPPVTTPPVTTPDPVTPPPATDPVTPPPAVDPVPEAPAT